MAIDVTTPRSKGNWLGRANWPMIIYMAIVHAGAAYSVTYFTTMKPLTIGWFFIMYLLSGFGITAGAHRLWAHRAYKAHSSVRFFLMICNCMANQGTIFHWSRDHRVHHKYSDLPPDPYDSGRGLFFSHMGWLLLKKSKRVYEAGRTLNMDDLWEDWTVRLQAKYNPYGQLFFCFIFPTWVACHFWGESIGAGLFVVGFLRYICVLHATWMVNSIAHFYGSAPYDEMIRPKENAFVTIFAVGEGWHNWHHKFPQDYATSEHGAFRQFNPTKTLIDIWADIGLVTDRKKCNDLWAKIKIAKEKKAALQNKEKSIEKAKAA